VLRACCLLSGDLHEAGICMATLPTRPFTPAVFSWEGGEVGAEVRILANKVGNVDDITSLQSLESLDILVLQFSHW
jgi:hypothetical protein